jgi:hypothetical protein
LPKLVRLRQLHIQYRSVFLSAGKTAGGIQRNEAAATRRADRRGDDEEEEEEVGRQPLHITRERSLKSITNWWRSSLEAGPTPPSPAPGMWTYAGDSFPGVYTLKECSRGVYCGGVFQGCIYCGGVLVDRLEGEICTGRREKKEKMIGTVQEEEGKRQHVTG